MTNRFDAGFEDKVALITGGASGIGLATAKRLKSEGAAVVIADLDDARGKREAEQIGADFVHLDVSDSEAWRSVVADVSARHGGLDLAYLNAGVTTYPAAIETMIRPFDIADLPDENYRRIMGANLDGVVFGARAVVPAIEARGGGAIVATASCAGVIAFYPDPIYTATKHAVVGLVRSLAPSLEARGISCNAVLPGAVDTNILGEGFADRAREVGIAVIAPERIADAVVNAVTAGSTGQLWICVADRPPYPYEFREVDGLGPVRSFE